MKFAVAIALGVAATLCFVIPAAAWDVETVADTDDLEAIVDVAWTNNSLAKIIPPGDFDYNNTLGVIAYEDGFDTNFLAALLVVTNGTGTNTFLRYPVEVIETTNGSDRVRYYMSAISTNPTAVHTTTVLIANYPEDWIEEVYGEAPEWLSGAALQQWYDDRDPWRQHVYCDLIATNSIPDYVAWLTNFIPVYSDGTNTNSLLTIYSNDIAFVEIESGSGGIDIYLHAPTNVPTLDLFKSTNLLETYGWTLPATLDHTIDPILWTYTEADSPAFFASGNAAVDSDGDGLADIREIRMHGTSIYLADSDGDGLSDGVEVLTYGLDPLSTDTDGDGIPDDEEVASGTSPGSADSDGDGLTDYEEIYLYFTLPYDTDSDDDGVSDYNEIITYNSYPWAVNSDGDCRDSNGTDLDDGEEVTAGTSLTSVDTDGDGIDDATELYWGWSPTDPSNASQDDDGDGLSNLVEYQNSWHPQLNSSNQWYKDMHLISRYPDTNVVWHLANFRYDECVSLGDAGNASAMLRIPPSKPIGGTETKLLWWSGSTTGIYLNGTEISAMTEPLAVPDSSGTVEYHVTADVSAQGNSIMFSLTDSRTNNTYSCNDVTFQVPKLDWVTLSSSGANKSVLHGATDQWFVGLGGAQTSAVVRVTPVIMDDPLEGVPVDGATVQSYACVRVDGSGASPSTVNMNGHDWRSAARRGISLSAGSYLFNMGFDMDLSDSLDTAEITQACTVTVVRVNLDIARKDTSTVPEQDEDTIGSIVQIAPTNQPGPSLALPTLSVEPSAATSSLTLKLKKTSPSGNAGKIRVYRNGVLVMGQDETTKTISAGDLSGTWTVDSIAGGVVDLELRAEYPAGTKIAGDTVRISGIPCEPADGRIVFVNPSATAHNAPFHDIKSNAASTIASALAIAAGFPDCNILLARTTYQESGLCLTTPAVIAGLGGSWSGGSFDYSNLPILTRPSGSGMIPSLLAVYPNGAASVAGLACTNAFSLVGGAIHVLGAAHPVHIERCDFRYNKASSAGGAVYLTGITEAVVDECRFDGNRARHETSTAAYDIGVGGAIAAIESTLTVTSSVFGSITGNVAEVVGSGDTLPPVGSAGGGGDIYSKKSTLRVHNCTLKNSVAGKERTAGNLSADQFTGDGGSILMHGTSADSALEIRDSSFEKTVAYGNGGAISISYDGSSQARAYFVPELGLGWPPVADRPTTLGGGCIGVISGTTFAGSQGGWQGGSISANGRSVSLVVSNCLFDACEAGTTHTRDGKAAAVAVGGGLQCDDSPENSVTVVDCDILDGTASGNGGGLYVTIRGKLILAGQVQIENCAAQDGASDSMHEGMGGGLHVSAGGHLRMEANCNLTMSSDGAATSGGGLSVKSGNAYLSGTVIIQTNAANGTASSGYGNGGGIFVTTSFHDDLPPFGAGWGAASIWGHGLAEATNAAVNVSYNTAERWGGGVYVGLADPWYGDANVSASKVTLSGISILQNEAGMEASGSSLLPAQVTFERVQSDILTPPFWSAVGSVENSTIEGNPTTDIGVYMLDAITVNTNGCSFNYLAAEVISE